MILVKGIFHSLFFVLGSIFLSSFNMIYLIAGENILVSFIGKFLILFFCDFLCVNFNNPIP